MKILHFFLSFFKTWQNFTSKYLIKNLTLIDLGWRKAVVKPQFYLFGTKDASRDEMAFPTVSMLVSLHSTSQVSCLYVLFFWTNPFRIMVASVKGIEAPEHSLGRSLVSEYKNTNIQY